MYNIKDIIESGIGSNTIINSLFEEKNWEELLYYLKFNKSKFIDAHQSLLNLVISYIEDLNYDKAIEGLNSLYNSSPDEVKFLISNFI